MNHYGENNIFCIKQKLKLNKVNTIIILTITIYTLHFFVNKNKTNETNKTTEKINEIINSNIINEEVKPEENNKVQENNNQQQTANDIKTSKPKKKSAYFKNYSKAINELKKINKDTVGWLSINNSM